MLLYYIILYYIILCYTLYYTWYIPSLRSERGPRSEARAPEAREARLPRRPSPGRGFDEMLAPASGRSSAAEETSLADASPRQPGKDALPRKEGEGDMQGGDGASKGLGEHGSTGGGTQGHGEVFGDEEGRAWACERLYGCVRVYARIQTLSNTVNMTSWCISLRTLLRLLFRLSSQKAGSGVWRTLKATRGAGCVREHLAHLTSPQRQGVHGVAHNILSLSLSLSLSLYIYMYEYIYIYI